MLFKYSSCVVQVQQLCRSSTVATSFKCSSYVSVAKLCFNHYVWTAKLYFDRYVSTATLDGMGQRFHLSQNLSQKGGFKIAQKI